MSSVSKTGWAMQGWDLVAFYGFLRASEFASSNLLWSNVELTPITVTIHLQHSKTDVDNPSPFKPYQHLPAQCGQSIYLTVRTGPLYRGGCFDHLSREQLTRALHNLLHLAGYKQNHYIASHSFRIGAATTAAAAGLPT